MGFKPIVHIGVPKSATTLFQQHLFTDQSLFYALGRFGVGGDMCVDNDLRELIWDGLYLDERAWLVGRDRFKEALAKHLAQAESRGLRPVISNEAISQNYYGRSDFDARFSRLQEVLGSEATILMLTRRQDKWMKSYYSSLVCDAGASMSFRTFYEINRRMPLNEHCVISSIDYSHIIDVAKRYFANVKVMPFELLTERPEEGRAMLAGFLDVDRVNLPEEKVNQSRDLEVIGYARALNRAFPVGAACPQESMPRLFRREAFNVVLRKVQAGQPVTEFEAEMIKQVQAERSQQMLTLHNHKNLKSICDLLRIEPMMDDIEPTEEQMSTLLGLFQDSNKSLSETIGMDLSEFGYY